jgi:zinc finger protein
VRIPDIEFEIPPGTQKGEISTIEGFLGVAAKNLGMYQDERMAQMPEVGAKVADVILALTNYSMRRSLPFTIIVDDPSGNSFIENPYAPAKDPNLSISYYLRTAEQDASLGLAHDHGVYKDDISTNLKALMTGA